MAKKPAGVAFEKHPKMLKGYGGAPKMIPEGVRPQPAFKQVPKRGFGVKTPMSGGDGF